MNCKLKVVHYLNGDVVSTSGDSIKNEHYTIPGMSEESYELQIYFSPSQYACGWSLCGTSKSALYPDSFYYYDENGTEQNPNLCNWYSISDKFGYTGKWFHYTDSKFILCDNPDHHASN